jgi:hypothetical protein
MFIFVDPDPVGSETFCLSRYGSTIKMERQKFSQTQYVQNLVLRIRIHRIHMFLGLPDPERLVRGMDPDPDRSIIMQK